MQQKYTLPSSNGNGAVRTISYEEYIVDTALELLREIARHFEALEKDLPDKGDAKLAGQNSRLAYTAVDGLRRIKVI